MMALSPLDRQVLVNGARLAYCDQGKSGQGRGEPVVFLHGTPSHAMIWRDVLPQVAAAGCRVLAYDLLGYGQSERPLGRDTSVPAQAALLHELLAVLDIGEVNLVGHDIGGAVAQIFATEHPQRLRRLMLVDTVSYDSWPSQTWREIIANHLDDYAAMPADAFEAMLARQLRMTVADPERMSANVLDAYLEPHRSAMGRASFFEHQVRHYDSVHTRRITPLLPSLTMPTRILWGAEDSWQPESYAHRLAGDIPGSADPTVLPGSGHFLPEEAPDAVVQEVLSMLAAPV